MLIKSVVLLFCCALINAKSLVQRDSRLEGRGEIEHAKLPDILKGFIRDVKIPDVDRPDGDNKLSANPQVKQEEDDDEEEDESSSDADEEEKQVPEIPNAEADQEEDEEDDDEEDEIKEEVELENTKNQNESNKEEEEEEDDDDDDKENQDQKESKNDKNDSAAESEESSEEESNKYAQEDTPKEETPTFRLSKALVGSEMKSPETFKLSKQLIDFPSPVVKTPTAYDELADKFANFFALESLLKSFLPSTNSSPKETISETKTNEESLIKEIEEMEKANNVAEQQIVTSNQAPGPVFDFDLDDTKQLGAFISQTVPKNFDVIQAQFQGAKDFWKKTTFNDLQATLQQGVQNFWQKTNFNDLLTKFQQGAKGLLQENIEEHKEQSLHKESKVGFGGGVNNQNNKPMFSNATAYVNKAVQRAQAQLDDNGRTIGANNPPLTINVIPGTPITFKLKYVEGAHTLDTYGQSKAIHYGKVYAFTQYKFTELRYYYDVIISPCKLYNIRKNITFILNDAPVKMNAAVDNDNKMNIMALEFVNPELEVDSDSNQFVQYILNYLINAHPVIKQKMVEIVSRDSKLLLSDYLKDAQ